MKVSLFTNATILDATKDMLLSIDKRDFSQEHIVVVPDKYSLQTERNILSMLGESLFNVRVLSLTSLAGELLDNLGIKCEVVSGEECLLLTQKAIDEVCDNFKVFKRGDFGFCQEMRKLISQLKSSCVESEDLLCKEGGLSAGKYHDIKLVYDKYNEFLGGRLDQNGKLMLASRFIQDNALKNKHYYFAYFDAFTSEGYKLIESLIKFAESVSFACSQPLSVGNEYLYDKDIKNKIIRLATANGVNVCVKGGEGVFSPQKEGILKGVMSYERVHAPNDGFYTLLGANSIEEEVEFVAKSIFYLLHKGHKYQDFGVYVGDMNAYHGVIDRIFKAFDFVYFIDTPTSADKTLIARAIKSLFNFALQGQQKEDLINLFLNPLFKSEHLVDIVLKKDVSGKYAYKKFFSSFPYDWFFEECNLCKSVKDYTALVRKFLREIEGDFLDYWREKEGDYLKQAGEDRQAFDLAKDCLDILDKYDSLIKGEEFISRFMGLLAMTDLSSIPSYVDGICVLDGNNSNMEEKKFVFIVGGQNLPVSVNEGGLLSDEELGENIKKEISPTIRMINRRNRFKLFTLLSTPLRSLIITYQILNEEGKKGELPSYITSLNGIFSQKEERITRFLQSGKNGRGRLLNMGNRACLINDIEKLSDREREELDLEVFLPYKGKMERDFLNEEGEPIFFGDKKFSSSQLETYFACPFKHFVRYGLKLKEVEEKDFSPADIGNICHKMGELFINKLSKEDFNLSLWNKQRIREFVQHNFERVISLLELAEKFQESADKRQLTSYLHSYLVSFLCDVQKELSHTSLRPLPPERGVSSVSIDSLSLKGRADRVDQGGGYIRIIDYKTGKTGDILKELYFGKKLQLFLYASSLQEEIGLPVGGVFYFNAKLEYSGSEEEGKLLKGLVRNDDSFISLLDSDLEDVGKSGLLGIEKCKDEKKGAYKGRCIADLDFSVYQKYALKVAEGGIQEIKQGYISPKPLQGACDKCAYRGICLYSSRRGERLYNGKINFEE